MKNSGSHANRKEKTLKMFLSQTKRAAALHVVSYCDPYQNTSNFDPGMEVDPMLCGLGFYIAIKKEILKNLPVPNCKI